MRAAKQIMRAVLWMSMLLFFGSVAHAEEESETVVRVGFPVQKGISYLDENGNHAGYLVDYLEKINLFTDWNIEYIQVDGNLNTQLETLMDMLLRGEIDLLGTMNRNEILEEMFLYPGYSYGTSYTVLAVREDTQEWIEEDFEHWDGIRVGYCPSYEGRVKQLEHYANVNDFSYELVEYASYEEMLHAVLEGKVDAVIQVDISLEDGLSSIGRFSPSPYYFALNKANTKMLQQLDAALRGINVSYPGLQTELYNRYFQFSHEFMISQENRDYIQSLGTLKVLFFSGNAPFQYVKNGKLQGFAVQYFEQFAEKTGLQYETVVAESYAEGRTLIEERKVDLVACVATNSPLIAEDAIRFSLPYFNSFSVSACANSKPHSHVGQEDLQFRTNTENALAQMQSNTCYAAQVDSYSLNYYLRKEEIYDDIVIDWADIHGFSYTIGVETHISGSLLELFNRYASTMSEDVRQAMLYPYASDSVEYTSGELLVVYKTEIIACILVSCLLILTLILVYRNRKACYAALLSENRLLHLSIFDELTGAYTGTHFCKLLSEACEQKRRMVLVAFNIRSFKYINDTYGIKRANQLLCAVKILLDSYLTEEEFYCRQSADLFYMAMMGQESAEVQSRVQEILEGICDTASEILDGYPLSVYCGAVDIGSSPNPYSMHANVNFVLSALAHARTSNRIPVFFYNDALYQADQTRYYIESHMHSALEQEEYKLYLQPKKNFQTGRVDSAEALVRWQPKDREMLFPNQFIPLFEENGFCEHLDLYMVEQVCKRIQYWIKEGIEPIEISVNQTKSLFISEGYVEKLLAITNKYNVSPKYIILEILEGMAFENIEALNATIQALNQVGFRVSMDDFGSGYSSLNTLGKLRINELKLDRLFLMDVVKDVYGSQMEVLASVFALAKKLGIRTVAEGVENLESEAMMKDMCCDYGQGYYYSKPIPVEEFEKQYLSRGNR